MSKITGHCNCGAVGLTIPKPPAITICHCTGCRRSGGTVAGAIIPLDPSTMDLSGTPKKYITEGSSGKEVTRNFCGDCGSPVYTVTEAMPDIAFVKAGLFDPGDVPKPNTHLFTKNMEDWEHLEPGAEKKESQ